MSNEKQLQEKCLEEAINEKLTTAHDEWVDEFALGVYQAELEYNEAKKEYDELYNKITLEVNWEEINKKMKKKKMKNLKKKMKKMTMI